MKITTECVSFIAWSQHPVVAVCHTYRRADGGGWVDGWVDSRGRWLGDKMEGWVGGITERWIGVAACVGASLHGRKADSVQTAVLKAVLVSFDSQPGSTLVSWVPWKKTTLTLSGSMGPLCKRSAVLASLSLLQHGHTIYSLAPRDGM